MNQHKLIVDPKVWEYDYHSNPNEPPEKRLEYMLGYQMSRLRKMAGCLKHDDRADALAQGVKWFTDALHISALDQIATRKRDEFNALLEDFLDHPKTLRTT